MLALEKAVFMLAEYCAARTTNATVSGQLSGRAGRVQTEVEHPAGTVVLFVRAGIPRGGRDGWESPWRRSFRNLLLFTSKLTSRKAKRVSKLSLLCASL